MVRGHPRPERSGEGKFQTPHTQRLRPISSSLPNPTTPIHSPTQNKVVPGHRTPEFLRRPSLRRPSPCARAPEGPSAFSLQSPPNFCEMDRGHNGEGFRGRDPFAAGFVGFGPHRSLISGLFGGRDPFDDPFFTHPFGGRMMGDHDMFGPSPFGPMGVPFGDMSNDGFIEQAPPRGNSRRPVITEVDDDEGENTEHINEQHNQDFYVQEPDDGSDGTEGGQVQLHRDLNRANSGGQPQTRTFTYQSSSVTYGGINGAYYTASKTRRTGSDGITVEESKEADTTTKEATHRISRGIHDKGHSFTRKLNSDGNVDTTQTLHNLNEDELAGFEESWKGNAGHYLPGWNQNTGAPNSDNSGNRSSNGHDRRSAWGWALPGTEQGRDSRRNGKPKSRVIPIS